MLELTNDIGTDAELLALKRIASFWQRNPTFHPELRADFSVWQRTVEQYLAAKNSSVGATTDEYVHYKNAHKHLADICIKLYNKTYSDLISVYLGLFTQPVGVSIGELEISFTDRLSYMRVHETLVRKREEFIDTQTAIEESAASKDAPQNDYVNRQIKVATEKLQKLESLAPPAWFDVERVFELPTLIRTEQIIGASITLHNRGREECSVIYTEKLSPYAIVVNDDNVFETSSGTALEYKLSVPPGKYVTIHYKFYATQIGEIEFDADLTYPDQKTGWDYLVRNQSNQLKFSEQLTVTYEAEPPDVQINRFYRYRRPGNTEILVKITNHAGCRIVKDLALFDSFVLDGEVHQERSEPQSRIIYPGIEPVWATYILDGHWDNRTLHFSDESNLQGIDNEDKEYLFPIGKDCTLLEYETLRTHDELVGRDVQKAQIGKIINEILQRQTPFRVVHIVGLQGTGKTRLLRELEDQCRNKGFQVFRIRVERYHFNPLARIILQLLNMKPEKQELQEIEIALNLIPELAGVSHYIFRDTLERFLTPSLQSNYEIDITVLSQSISHLLKHFVQQSPLLIGFDDAHEIQSIIYLELFRSIFAGLAESNIPIIFAFAETTNHTSSSHDSAELDKSLLTYFPSNLQVVPLVSENLSPEECKYLIDQLIPYPKLDKDLKFFVYNISQGLPQQIIDILLWLTTQGNSKNTTSYPPIDLRGNLWTMAPTFSGSEVQFQNVAAIILNLARDYLSKDEFRYLQILSVVGEIIPIAIAHELYKANFLSKQEPEIQFQKMIDALRKIDFLRQTNEDALEFTHLSRRNSIFEDSYLGSTDKQIYREQIVAVILSASKGTYWNPEEIHSQAAHYLIRYSRSLQPYEVEVLTQAALREFNRCNLRLGRRLMDKITQSLQQMGNTVLSISSIDLMRRIVELKLSLARQIVDLTGRYDEALQILAEAENDLHLPDETETPSREIRISAILIDKVKAAAYLGKAMTVAYTLEEKLDDIAEARRLSAGARHDLRRLQPLRIPFISRPDLNRFPYIELMGLYLLFAKAVFEKQSINIKYSIESDSFAGDYGWIISAENDIQRALKLAKWLRRGKNVDTALLARMEIEFARVYVDRQDFARAKDAFRQVNNFAHSAKLPFYEGRSLLGLAEVSTQEKISVQDSSGGNSQKLKIIAIYENALRLHREVGDIVGMIKAHTALGLLYEDRDEEEALKHYEASISICGEWGHSKECWICCLGALKLLLAKTDFKNCSRIWSRAYDIYYRYGEDDEARQQELPNRAEFVKIASSLSTYFEQKHDLVRQRQTVEILINEMPDSAHEKLYRLYIQEGDLWLNLGKLQFASEAYWEGYRESRQVNHEAQIKCHQRLAQLYRRSDWIPTFTSHPATAATEIKEAVNIRIADPVKLNIPLEKAKVITLSQEAMAQLFSAMRDSTSTEGIDIHSLSPDIQLPILKTLSSSEVETKSIWKIEEPEYHLEAICILYAQDENDKEFFAAYNDLLELADRNDNFPRFSRSYLAILRTVRGKIARFEQLAYFTAKRLINRKLLVRAGEILTYTGRQFLRTDVREQESRAGIRYFEKAEDLFIQAGGDAIIYGLNGLFFGYFMLGYFEGFGRCAVKLLDWATSNANISERDFILRVLVRDTVIRKIPVPDLACIRDRVDKLVAGIALEFLQDELQMLRYKAWIHCCLGERYNAERETLYSLKTCGYIIERQGKSDSWVLNQIGLCYGNLNDPLKKVVAYQEDARIVTRENYNGQAVAVPLLNLANAYINLDLYQYAAPLLNTAYKETIWECQYWDEKLKFIDLTSSDHTGLAETVSAMAARETLVLILRAWENYFQKVDSDNTLIAQIRAEISALESQQKMPKLVISQPILKSLSFPESRIGLSEALNVKPNNAPTIQQILAQIRELSGLISPVEGIQNEKKTEKRKKHK